MNLNAAYNALRSSSYKNIDIEAVPFSKEEFLKIPHARSAVFEILTALKPDDLIKFDKKHNLFSIENFEDYIKEHGHERRENYILKVNYLTSKFDNKDIINILIKEAKEDEFFATSFLFKCYKKAVLIDFLLENKKIVHEHYSSDFFFKMNKYFLSDSFSNNGALYFISGNERGPDFEKDFIKSDSMFNFLNIEFLADFMNVNEYYKFGKDIYDALENKLGKDNIINFVIDDKNNKSLKNTYLFTAIKHSLFGAFIEEIISGKIELTEDDKLIIKAEALNTRNSYRENFETINSINDVEEPVYSEFMKTLTMPNPVKNLKSFIKKNKKELPKIWKIVKQKENDYTYPNFTSRKSKNNMSLEISPVAAIVNSRTTTECLFMLIKNGYPLLEKEKGYLPFVIMNNFNYYDEESTDYLIKLCKKYKNSIDIESTFAFLCHKKPKEEILLTKVKDMIEDTFDFNKIKLDFNPDQKKILKNYLIKNDENIVCIYPLFNSILKANNHNLNLKEMDFIKYLFLPYTLAMNNTVNCYDFSDSIIKEYKDILSEHEKNKISSIIESYNHAGIFNANDAFYAGDKEPHIEIMNILKQAMINDYMNKYVDFVNTLLEQKIIDPENILLLNESLGNYLKTTRGRDLKSDLYYHPVFEDNYAKFIEKKIMEKYPDTFVYQKNETPKKRL